MPVILRVRGYRFWFYSADLDEPPHVDVGKAGNEAKYWLAPIALARQRGFRPPELREVQGILIAHQNDLLTAWQDAKEQRYLVLLAPMGEWPGCPAQRVPRRPQRHSQLEYL